MNIAQILAIVAWSLIHQVEENGLEQVKHVADKLDDQEDQRQRDEDEDGDERDGDRAAVVEEEGETEQRDVPLKQQPKNKLTGTEKSSFGHPS